MRDKVFIKNTEYVIRPRTVNILWFTREFKTPESIKYNLKLENILKIFNISLKWS